MWYDIVIYNKYKFDFLPNFWHSAPETLEMFYVTRAMKNGTWLLWNQPRHSCVNVQTPPPFQTPGRGNWRLSLITSWQWLNHSCLCNKPPQKPKRKGFGETVLGSRWRCWESARAGEGTKLQDLPIPCPMNLFHLDIHQHPLSCTFIINQ